MIDSSLYDDPELYDLLFGAEPEVIQFYVEQASRSSGPILELACGTGEILVPIARTGADVVGLDASPSMLSHARTKAAAAGARVQLVQADMRTFELGRRFGLVFVASNSLLHLHDLHSLRQFFAQVRRHLAPSARLIFDVSNPDVRWLARAPAERRQLGHITHAQWGELSLEESTDYDAAAQVTRSRWYLCSPQHRNLGRFSLRLRNLFPRELELLVESCGFTLVSRFGDFDGVPFTATSPRQVCVCEVSGVLEPDCRQAH